jgi:hypothetical protein
MTAPSTSSIDPERRPSRTRTAAAAAATVILLLAVGAGIALTRASGSPAADTAKQQAEGRPPSSTPTAAGCGTATPNREPAGTAAPPDGDTTPTVVQHPDNPPPASPHLRTLHSQIAGAAPDPSPCGRYAFVRLRQWAADTTIGPDGLGTTTTMRFEYARWRADDGSGRIVATRIGDPTPSTTDETYRPGLLTEGIAGPLTTDPTRLAKQMTQLHPVVIGQAAYLRATADIYGWHIPHRDQRTAILTVLAGHNLQWRGNTIDRGGRPGVAVSADNDNGTTRDMLTLDPATGEVLAYELVFLRNPGGLTGVFPAVQDYRLFLEHRHAATTSIT